MFFHCKRLREGFKLPTYGFNPEQNLIVDPDAVGCDIYAPEDGFINALSRRLVPLGFAANFTIGYMGLLLDRSGMGNKGIHRFGGVIDPRYPDEWGAILYNSNSHAFHYKQGDRIVQVVFVKVEKPIPTEVDELEESGSRSGRIGGFGSTGV